MNVVKYTLGYYIGPCIIATSTYWLIRYVFYVIWQFHLMDCLKKKKNYCFEAGTTLHYPLESRFKIWVVCPRTVSCARRCRWPNVRQVDVSCRSLSPPRRCRLRPAAGWWAQRKEASASRAAPSPAASCPEYTPPKPLLCPWLQQHQAIWYPLPDLELFPPENMNK